MIKPLKWDEDTTPTKHANAIHAKVDELIDAVNELEEAVYASPDDDCDICPDCWAETGPFIANLPDLSDEQLIALHDRVSDLLDQRLDDDDDVYCEQCNDYHDLPDDDDEGGERSYISTLKETPLFKEVDTSDGLFADFTAYVAQNPKLRFFQAVRNFSGYNFIFGSTAKDADDYSQLENTFNLKTKGLKKGSQS